MRRTRRVVAVCLILCFPVVLFSQTDRDIALLYVEAAEEALSGGEAERADQLMQIAREFAPQSSDVLYLSASVDSLERETTVLAIERARSAMEHASWGRYSPIHGAVLLSSVLNRAGRSSESIAVLESTALTPDAPDEIVGDFYYQSLRALNALGRLSDADSLIAVARDRFPNDPRYFQFVVERERTVTREHRLELERLIGAPDASRWGESLNRLLFEYTMRAPTETEREWATGRLSQRGWNDARLARAMLPDAPDRALGWFLAHDGVTDLAVYFELLESLDADGASAIRQAASEFTGWSERDTDEDGFWNERVGVENGAMVRWQRDLDQDGIVELDVTFGVAAPSEVVVRDEETTVRLRFSQYPYLAEGEIATQLGSEVFVLRPRAVRFDVMQPLSSEGPRFDGASRVSGSVRRVRRRELIAASIRIDHIRADGSIAERIFNEAGTRSRILRDESGNGVWDHFMLTDGGLVVSGVRDIDDDGYHEVAEAYRNGRLVAIAIDSDDDGVPEVFEQYDRLGAREWDVNEDGRIDVREFSFWTDSVLREFPLSDQDR